MKNWFLIVLVYVLTSSCLSYKDLEYRSFEGVNIEKMDGDEMLIGISVKVFNPNNYAIKIKEADFKAEFAGKDLGDINLVNTVKIDANKESIQKVVVKLSSKKVLSMVPMAFLTGNSKLTLNGNLKVKVFLFSKKFPINISENINLGDLKL